ncbi:MAG: 16S rRNA (uracil(1498)-N(3))-methyltransferase [Acidobacteria bacterium]|jgi:16S rRNA (uracil1498-N3)-methyltransferase|nr:16S rRNA (uracil(1498)-N(3))-methyltransferase [Acidobacteriota bacterium]
MENRRFITDRLPSGNHVFITGDELHHLKTVNRAKCGTEIEVIDGKGTCYSGKIKSMANHEAVVEITGHKTHEKPPVRITIAPSLIKKKAMAVLVEKLAEIGVDEIRPVIFNRTDEKYHHTLLKKWQRIARQTLKVNGKLWPTEIFPPVNLEQLIAGTRDTDAKIMLHMDGLRENIHDAWNKKMNIISVIGPPGDFLPEEKSLLEKNGFVCINLNEGILKTETAAISTAAILKFHGPYTPGESLIS